MDHDLIRLGVVWCGGFGLFSLQHLIQVPGVTLVGMAGTHRPAALAALEAAKHVIVERPLALTVAKADEQVAVARR